MATLRPNVCIKICFMPMGSLSPNVFQSTVSQDKCPVRLMCTDGMCNALMRSEITTWLNKPSHLPSNLQQTIHRACAHGQHMFIWER